MLIVLSHCVLRQFVIQHSCGNCLDISPTLSPLLSVVEQHQTYQFKRLGQVPQHKILAHAIPPLPRTVSYASLPRPLLASTLIQYIYSSILSSKAASLGKPFLPSWGKTNFFTRDLCYFICVTLYQNIFLLTSLLLAIL